MQVSQQYSGTKIPVIILPEANANPEANQKMRTYMMHTQPPIFRVKDTPVSIRETKREIVQALQAVCDAYRGTDSLLLLQCQSALKKAQNL